MVGYKLTSSNGVPPWYRGIKSEDNGTLRFVGPGDVWATERLIYNNRLYAIQELREKLLKIKQE